MTVPMVVLDGERSAGVNLDRGGWAARSEEGRYAVGGGNGRRVVPFFKDQLPVKIQVLSVYQRCGAHAADGERGSQGLTGSVMEP